ncbi:unnamed protein product [Didymodactylos carnosus]|uniref:DED domain-containing protein n=1 Tax=Didymodactylos carnosus TaxID=1234261 RepID=A0A814F3D8_9BILA|nr:unnamed protein product [Didymodactylos carnosus]CAF0975984.1 unnamed protein product [Didymodactylos carnosus]CAF3543230.1 unnamed protein product [Didymodactylos carnosus]CAF3748845.1 unnamed protein product [Didymodactylos carnosus]
MIPIFFKTLPLDSTWLKTYNSSLLWGGVLKKLKKLNLGSLRKNDNPMEAEEGHFRKVLIDISDQLSEEECRKLKFLLGKDISRRIRYDPTIGDTWDLFEQLPERCKISAKEFTYLIEAFESIKCIVAADILKGKCNVLNAF